MPRDPKCEKRSARRPVYTIKLTEKREITPYKCDEAGH
jgi:hypothetical protein